MRVASSSITRTCATVLVALFAIAQPVSARADALLVEKPIAKPIAKSKKQKAKRKPVQKSALYAVSLPTLRNFGATLVEPTPTIIARLADQFAPEPALDFDPELALQRANSEHPVQVPLYDNLNLEWQLKNYPTADRYVDVGMKVELRVRF